MKKAIIVFIAAAMMLSCSIVAFAVKEDYMPSVTVKDAPEALPVDEGADAIGFSEEDTELVRVPEGYLIITPYSQKDAVGTHADAKKSLNDAMKDIVKAKDLGVLDKELTQLAKEIDPAYTSRNFIVSQLFDVRVIGEPYETQIDDEGVAYVLIKLSDEHLSEGDDAPVILLRGDDAGTKPWSVIPEEDITVGEGFFLLKLKDFGALAILSVIDKPVNPGTFDGLHVVAGIAAVCLAAFGFALIIKRRRSEV